MQGFNVNNGIQEHILNQQTTLDIWSLYHGIPNIKVARDAFASIVFCAPFTVETKSLPLKLSEEIEVLIERYWIKWQQDVYDWLKMFGVCPYIKEKVRGTLHKVPVVPPFGSGYISTFINKKHQQKWKWYWNHTPGHVGQSLNTEEKRMDWVIGAHPPTIFGQYTSPVSTMVNDYRTLKILRESLEVAAYQGARPPFLYEHHPPKDGSSQDHLVSLEAFGERAAGTMMEEVERMTARKAQIRTSDLMSNLMQTYMHNKHLNGAGKKYPGATPYQQLSEDQARRADIETPGIFTRSFPLRPDFKYVQPAQPKVMADLEKMARHVDTIAASIMDFPLELIQPSTSARGAGNVQGNIRYINEQIKSTLKFFARITKRAFIQIYGDQIQNGMNEYVTLRRRAFPAHRHEIMDMFVEREITVEMQCNPIISVNDIERLHMMGIMDKKTMAEHAFAQYALPATQIKVRDWPDRVPKELLVKTQTQAPKTSLKNDKKKEKPEKEISAAVQIEEKK